MGQIKTHKKKSSTEVKKKLSLHHRINLDKLCEKYENFNYQVDDFNKILSNYSIPSFEEENDMSEIIQTLKSKSQKRRLTNPKKKEKSNDTENKIKTTIDDTVLSNFFNTKSNEIELKQSVTNDLYQVVYVIEDTLVSPQSVPASWNIPGNIDYNYVHRDIMRGCIDGKALGQKLIPAMKVDKNGKPTQGEKYYINYSYKIPNIYDENNLHFLIYVYDGLSKEILQVIKQDI